MSVIVIFGSTGTAGSGAVRACLDHPDVVEVRAVTRRPLGLSHEKLVELTCTDFADLDPIAGHLAGVDCCLFCLGISASKVNGRSCCAMNFWCEASLSGEIPKMTMSFFWNSPIRSRNPWASLVQPDVLSLG